MDQVSSMVAQPKLYYNIDGVGELAVGVMCLGFAFLQWEQIRSPEGAVWHSMWVFGIYFGSLFAMLHYGTKTVKERITYPRTGFVEYRRSDTVVWPAVIAGVAAPAVLGMIIVAGKLHWDTAALAALMGPGMAFGYARGFARTSPWKWSVAVAIALCSLLALIPVDSVANLTGTTARLVPLARFVVVEMRLMAAFGGILAISGGISFWLYLRHTQPPAPEGA